MAPIDVASLLAWRAPPGSFIETKRVLTTPAAVPAPPVPPSCLDGGNCATKEELMKLRDFAKVVDAHLDAPIQLARKARQTFERRACDFRYAELQGKPQELADAYGPLGPLAPGGSYLYEMRHWADSVLMLHRACARNPACSSLLGYLREHPEGDIGSGGSTGRAGSQLHDELRLACQVGKTRAPVPNDSPVWCHDGSCEQPSCRAWWKVIHPDQAMPKPWVDDRIEYDELKDVCSWFEKSRPSSTELNDYQHHIQAAASKLKDQFCSPRWVEGYCGESPTMHRHAECILKTGQRCPHGVVLPDTDLDDTANWEESFKEPKVEMVPFLVLPSDSSHESAKFSRTVLIRGFL